MSDDDDYLSDKFLAGLDQEATATKTYSQIRKEALKKSYRKNEENRAKSKRQREIEAREEGLSKSLFERAEEEEQIGLTSGNKALAMMMKMGFRPGQSLGKQPESLGEAVASTTVVSPDNAEENPLKPPSPPRHKTEPLPINEWSGKKGIGTVKRGRSPSTNERIAKMAKLEEESGHRTFRDRARQEYEERRAEGRLGPAQRTCSTLDEKAGKMLNVLWLNPNNPETFPSGLMEALTLHDEQYIPAPKSGETIQERLRRQMQADALSASPVVGEESAGMATLDEKRPADLSQQYDHDFLEEAKQFLRLQPQDRLELVLSYLRTTYAYCFYCGTEYGSQDELAVECPGPEEDDHD